MLLRYDTRFESAHWNDVVGGFEDLEVQSSSASITQNNAKRPIFYRRFCSRQYSRSIGHGLCNHYFPPKMMP